MFAMKLYTETPYIFRLKGAAIQSKTPLQFVIFNRLITQKKEYLYKYNLF